MTTGLFEINIKSQNVKYTHEQIIWHKFIPKRRKLPEMVFLKIKERNFKGKLGNNFDIVIRTDQAPNF